MLGVRFSILAGHKTGIAWLPSLRKGHRTCQANKKGPANFAGPLIASEFLYLVTSLGHCFRSLAITALGVAHSAAGHVVFDSPQPLPQPLGKLMARAPQPGL
jgi:hypothetical protein